MKTLLLAATVLASTLGVNAADAGEATKTELYATLSAAFDLYDAKCPGKMSTAFIVVVSMNEDKFSPKDKRKALGEQNNVIKHVGLSSWCNLLDGQMALMDKKFAESK